MTHIAFPLIGGNGVVLYAADIAGFEHFEAEVRNERDVRLGRVKPDMSYAVLKNGRRAVVAGNAEDNLAQLNCWRSENRL